MALNELFHFRSNGGECRTSMRRRSIACRIIGEDNACMASEEEIDRAKKRPVKSTLEISRACIYLASDVNPFADNRARWSLNRNKLRSLSLFPLCSDKTTTKPGSFANFTIIWRTYPLLEIPRALNVDLRWWDFHARVRCNLIRESKLRVNEKCTSCLVAPLTIMAMNRRIPSVGIIPVKEILYSSMVCYKWTLIGRYYGRSQRTRLLFVAT